MARKILLADDSVTAQNMGRKILADAGYEVTAVNNGSAALKKIQELKPDLVILDVYMPGYSGLEVCQRLKESQETARIPVLLSVGKLEPFKPEEAQRVRADGFIVKPFEASELLSALSKLEDKVVPRAEPSKPGRFARAMAAAEEADRGGRNATGNEDNGWKSRIGFPKQKSEAEAEEKVADESPIYNQVNRDLRTVVDKHAVEKEPSRTSVAEAPEATVDVAALVPPSLPNDVTPEEVAAIAAAVAQMQMAAAAGLDVEKPGSEIKALENLIPETGISETKPATKNETNSEPVEANLPTPAKALEVEERKDTGMAVAEVVSAPFVERESEVPVTMAATAESVVTASTRASCWTAVPVALDSEDAAISLEQEMQKGYAAVAVAEAEPVGFASMPEAQSAPAENSSVQAVAAVEVPAATISNPEPEPVPEPAAAMKAEPEAVSNPGGQSETSSLAPAGDTASVSLPEPAPVTESTPTEVASVQAEAEKSTVAELSQPRSEPAPISEIAAVATATVVTDSVVAQAQPSAAAEASTTEATSSVAVAPIIHDEYAAEEPRLDSETVKSTAAAWATWRQIRDSGEAKSGSEAETKPSEIAVPESMPAESAAMAVAAGAEQILREASAASEDKPSDVASIVDSVLADLRPKLMAEISRKISEKK